MKLRLLVCVFALFAVVFAVSLASVPQSTSAQVFATADPVCTNLVSQAVAAAGLLCGSTGNNTACLGNRAVSVDLRPGSNAEFNQPGAIVNLPDIQRINTTALDPQTGTWGIAVLKAQANLPDGEDQVTFVLFGDVTLDNPTADMLTVTINTRIGEPVCVGAPNSGVLIQSPKGRQVQMKINGADVTLGSCAFVTAEEQGDMAFSIIEGTGIISVGAAVRVVPPGSQVRIPLGGGLDGLQVSGPPSELEPFDYDAISVSPLSLLDCADPVPPTDVSPQPTGSLVGCTRTDWTFTYVVPFGDTLSRIASSIGISLTELAAGNGITNVNVLSTGQVLCVPREVPIFVFRTRTPSLTPTSTGTITATFLPTSTGTITATPTNTMTPLPTNTPTNTVTPLPTNTATNTVTPLPTNTLTATLEPTVEPPR